MNEYELMFCLASIVKAYEELPESGDDLEGWIEKARKLCDLYAEQNAAQERDRFLDGMGEPIETP